MYKAKILKINTDKTFTISIPALRLDQVKAYGLVHKTNEMGYREGDLVVVSETNDPAWVILGLIYGANT